MLVVGAGGVGGYFGGRLLAAGCDVTFLVRARRAAQLSSIGLAIRSVHGDVDIPSPPAVTVETLCESYDLVLLSCKAYDLDAAVASFTPAVGPDTVVLPLLNGMRHLDLLDTRFGAGRVLGGLCVISSSLDAEGRILHLNELHGITFGERDGARSARVEAIATELSKARFDSRLSEKILHEMWEKWVFIAAGAAITCLMRAPVGDIVAGGAADLASSLVDECAAIAAGQGFSPSEATVQRSRATFTAPHSLLAASMFRDVERRGPTEAAHILGDLLDRGPGAETPLLRIAYAHLKTYEARRARESAAS
ncbi:MAG TPA: 2-dehydropantoate 2-reductase [Bryobacteraceae bacterium]|nr:2-dehydropantoate 2-reductase [Bryobacteraceae bacterium]